MTILFVLGGIGALGLFLLARVPGIEHLIKPVIQILIDLLKLAAGNAATWSIYFGRGIWNAHTDVLRHLTHSAEAIDPTMRYEQQETPPDE